MFKYVILTDGVVEHPIIFPKNLVHLIIAAGTIAAYKAETGTEYKVISAGFVSIKPVDNVLGVWMEAYGESETLGIRSRPQDSSVLTNNPWTGGLVDAHMFVLPEGGMPDGKDL